ncbi:MAG: hypothetical protein ACJAZP_001871 [Psychromonas sp.]|jgi:hypothetical protein|uniref:hypothetical protein n=1 Tax=Psychromonas sp. TaxID=1884585 RepID=UPI0039E62664
MLNTILKPFTLLFFCLLLNACGGSGGESESASNILESSNETVSVVEPVAVESFVVEEGQLQIDYLVAAQDFSFTTKETIEVIVELNDDQRAYISVYKDYQLLDSGRYYPDSASRVMGGALQNGSFTQSFTGLNKQSQYLLEVWFYDGSEPLQQEIYVDNNQLIWQ